MNALFLLLICATVICSNMEMRHAVVKYFNPKYIKDAKVLTAKTRRNEPYRTNCTMTTLVPFGNNVTASFSYKLSGVDFTWKIKCCEINKHAWLYDYFKSISNVLLDQGGCPFQPQTYSIYNMEIPPKNMPLPLPKVDTTLTFRYSITATGEIIFEMQMDVNVK